MERLLYDPKTAAAMLSISLRSLAYLLARGDLIVTHLITRLENAGSISDGFMATLEHIANFVPEEEIAKLADLLIRQALKQPQDMASRFIAFAERYSITPTNLDRRYS